MDYLPLPSNPIHEPVEVPCLSAEEYDGGDLTTYPNRQGWGLRTVGEWQLVFADPPHKFLAFLQTWLFFGPLKLMFGDQFHQSDFTRQMNDPSYEGYLISTARLLSILKRWIDSGKQREIISSSNRGDIISGFLGEPLYLHGQLAKEWEELKGAQSAVDQTRPAELRSFIEHYSFKDPRHPTIATSEALLIETLLAALSHNFLRNDRERYLNTLNGTNFHLRGQKNFLYSRMRSDGWCPAELSMMFERLNGAALYFMSHMERPGPTKEHLIAQTSPAFSSTSASAVEAKEELVLSDSLCTQFKCSLYQLHEDTYQTKHTLECSGCYDIIADGNEVFDILKSGCIPMIVPIDREDETRKVKLVKSEPNLKYVAISHVWSDGLGNVQRSALPHCQMLRLSHLIRSLPGEASNTLHFWIDTIGCPPDVAGANEAQELAIGMMRKTYEDAYAVLVLDSWFGTKGHKAHLRCRDPKQNHMFCVEQQTLDSPRRSLSEDPVLSIRRYAVQSR